MDWKWVVEKKPRVAPPVTKCSTSAPSLRIPVFGSASNAIPGAAAVPSGARSGTVEVSARAETVSRRTPPAAIPSALLPGRKSPVSGSPFQTRPGAAAVPSEKPAPVR
ncbi:hypothetical protein GQY06_03310 [Cereibacter sphaeroides]|nr:hypothetical protein GQY06_03310 [Cereibacter sphaeroides]